MDNILYKIRKYTHKFAAPASRTQSHKRNEYVRHQQKHLKNLLHTIKRNMRGGNPPLANAAAGLKRFGDALKQKRQEIAEAADAAATAAAAELAANTTAARSTLAEKQAEIIKLTYQIQDATSNYNEQYKNALNIIREYKDLILSENLANSDEFDAGLDLQDKEKTYVNLDEKSPDFTLLAKKEAEWKDSV